MQFNINSPVLFLLAGALLLGLNHAMRGNWAYAAAALWGLVAVYARQSGSELEGSSTTAWIAIGIALVLGLKAVLKLVFAPILPQIPADFLRYFLTVAAAGIFWPMTFPWFAKIGKRHG